MPKTNQRLVNHLHYILIHRWNPIGVSDERYAQDEYDSHIPQILSLLALGEDDERIAAFLYQVETEHIGLHGNIEHVHQIAAEIIAANQLHRNLITIPCYTRVRILTDQYRDEQAPCGTIGYVIDIYTPEAYEVECSATNGVTFAQVVVHPDELIPDEPVLRQE